MTETTIKTCSNVESTVEECKSLGFAPERPKEFLCDSCPCNTPFCNKATPIKCVKCEAAYGDCSLGTCEGITCMTRVCTDPESYKVDKTQRKVKKTCAGANSGGPFKHYHETENGRKISCTEYRCTGPSCNEMLSIVLPEHEKFIKNGGNSKSGLIVLNIGNFIMLTIVTNCYRKFF